MKLSFLTNENGLLQQKMRYFADYYQFVNKYLGKLPSLPFETPVSLLDKIHDQIQYNKGRCFRSIDMYLSQLGFFTDEFTNYISSGYKELLASFKYNWVSKTRNEQKAWLENEDDIVVQIGKVKKEFEERMFKACLDALFTYMICEHSLDTHKEEIQRLTHIIVATFRLTGFSESQVAKHIDRILLKRNNDFPLPVDILKSINDSSFKEIRDAFLEKRDFKNQFNGLINILETYKHQKGIFLFAIDGVSLRDDEEKNFKANFDKVTFYSYNHPELKTVRKAVKEKDKVNKYTKVYSKFFKKDFLIAVVEMNFDKLEDGAKAGLKIVQFEAKYLFAYFGTPDLLIEDKGYLFTEKLNDCKIAYNVRLGRRRKDLQIPTSSCIENAKENAFSLLKKCNSKAAREILHNEFSHLKAFRNQDVSSYWVYIENVFWNRNVEQKEVRQKFTKLSLKILQDIFSSFNSDIGLLIEYSDYWGNYKELGLTQEQAKEIVNAVTVFKENLEFDWEKFLPFIKHDFLLDVIEVYKSLSSASSIPLWEKYFSDIALELFEFRNSDLHAGLVNKYSKLKLASILDYPMNRLRWIIINHAIDNPSKNYNEVISDLLK
jgi:molybdopterin-biosynthesis enzyme MoeA-like protein